MFHRRQNRAVILLLIIATLGIYLQVRHHEFVDIDDYRYIVQNPRLADGLTARNIALAFTQPQEAYWLPLTWISLQLDYSLYGLNPAGYLLTNVALHLCSVILLFLAFLRMTQDTWRSAFVAAIFAVHPLHAESVAWASERKDVLGALFWMLTLHAYIGSVTRPRSVARQLLVLLLFTLGLLAKPTLVTLPFALLLLDYWPLQRLGSRDVLHDPSTRRRIVDAVLEKVPLFLVTAAVSMVTFAMQDAMGGREMSGRMSAFQTTLNVLESYGAYLVMALWPSGLAVVYPLDPTSLTIRVAGVSAAVLLSITVFVLRARAAQPYLPVGWFWFVGTLVPMIGIVHVGIQSHADRFMHLPLIGLSLMVAWGAGELASKSSKSPTLVTTIALVSLVALSVAAWRQVGYWRNTDTLFERAIAVTTDNYYAQNRLAESYKRQLRLDEAETRYVETIRLAPWWIGPQLQLAEVIEFRGDAGTAKRLREAAERIVADERVADEALGIAWFDAGRFDAALPHLERTVATNPGSVDSWARLCAALAATGRRKDALHAAESALELAVADGDPERAARIRDLMRLHGGAPVDAVPSTNR